MQYQRNGTSSETSSKSSDAIDELKNAFELAERASLGISEMFVRSLFKKLIPSISEQNLRNAIDNVSK